MTQNNIQNIKNKKKTDFFSVTKNRFNKKIIVHNKKVGGKRCQKDIKRKIKQKKYYYL